MTNLTRIEDSDIHSLSLNQKLSTYKIKLPWESISIWNEALSSHFYKLDKIKMLSWTKGRSYPLFIWEPIQYQSFYISSLVSSLWYPEKLGIIILIFQIRKLRIFWVKRLNLSHLDSKSNAFSSPCRGSAESPFWKRTVHFFLPSQLLTIASTTDSHCHCSQE